LVADKWRTG